MDSTALDKAKEAVRRQHHETEAVVHGGFWIEEVAAERPGPKLSDGQALERHLVRQIRHLRKRMGIKGQFVAFRGPQLKEHARSGPGRPVAGGIVGFLFAFRRCIHKA